MACGGDVEYIARYGDDMLEIAGSRGEVAASGAVRLTEADSTYQRPAWAVSPHRGKRYGAVATGSNFRRGWRARGLAARARVARGTARILRPCGLLHGL